IIKYDPSFVRCVFASTLSSSSLFGTFATNYNEDCILEAELLVYDKAKGRKDLGSVQELQDAEGRSRKLDREDVRRGEAGFGGCREGCAELCKCLRG
ncbi:hypothetical protein BC938DRAFT_482431, partial [Jimgerdemannia flammicorona]